MGAQISARAAVSRLLRRTGFNAPGQAVDAAVTSGFAATVDRVLAAPPSTGTQPPSFRRTHRAGEGGQGGSADVREAAEGADRAAGAVVAGSDGGRRPAVGGEAHAALARALGDLGEEGEVAGRDGGTEPDRAAARWRGFRGFREANGTRPGADDLAGRERQHREGAKREPRPRADGAFHARSRALLGK